MRCICILISVLTATATLSSNKLEGRLGRPSDQLCNLEARRSGSLHLPDWAERAMPSRGNIVCRYKFLLEPPLPFILCSFAAFPLFSLCSLSGCSDTQGTTAQPGWLSNGELSSLSFCLPSLAPAPHAGRDAPKDEHQSHIKLNSLMVYDQLMTNFCTSAILILYTICAFLRAFDSLLTICFARCCLPGILGPMG